MKVTTTHIDGHTVLVYQYQANAHIGFKFHLLSEVGEPWQPLAKQALANLCYMRKSRVVQVELDRKPWYVDALVPE